MCIIVATSYCVVLLPFDTGEQEAASMLMRALHTENICGARDRVLNALQDLQRGLRSNLQTSRSVSLNASGRASPLSCDINQLSEIR